jgi:hypothetical protein
VSWRHAGLRPVRYAQLPDEEQAIKIYQRQMVRLENNAQESAEHHASDAKDRRKKNSQEPSRALYERLAKSLKDRLEDEFKLSKIDFWRAKSSQKEVEVRIDELRRAARSAVGAPASAKLESARAILS